MKKYATLLRLSLQDSLSERGSVFIWAFLDLLWPLAVIFVWLAIYGGGEGEIAGFNLSEMITYYLGVAFINAAASSHNEWNIFRTIRDGELSSYLVRPLRFFALELAGSLSWKILKGLLTLPFLLLAAFFFRRLLVFGISPAAVPALVVILALSYLLFFLNAFILGSLTFWLEDPSNVFSLNSLARNLFSGGLLPLTLFPPLFRKVAAFLPYRYLYDFPLRVLTGKSSAEEIFFGILMQLFWLGVCLAVCRFVWRRGVKAYCAFGG